MGKKAFFTFMLTVALMVMVTTSGYGIGGSIGHGDISVYKGGQLSTKLHGMNPVEDGATLVCDGKCIVKSEGISLIAQDQSKIAVVNELKTFKLYIKEGKIHFVVSSNARKISFYTPEGIYTLAEAVFNAGSGSAVKGSVVVADTGATEISITEGKMIFATAEGMKVVDANNKIVLAALEAPATGSSLLAASTTMVVPAAAAAANQSNSTGGEIARAQADQEVDETESKTTSSRPRPPASPAR